MSDLGKLLIGVGGLIVLMGAALVLADRVPGLGRLPGDIVVRRGNWTFYVPLATSLIVSILLTALFWFIGRR